MDFDRSFGHNSDRNLDRNSEYRRKPPHSHPAERTVFITLRKDSPQPFSPAARDVILQLCLHHAGRRYQLHAAVIMPEHVHLLLTPLRDESGWPWRVASILKTLKETSARSLQHLSPDQPTDDRPANSVAPVWREESFELLLRSAETLAAKVEDLRHNPVRRGLVSRPEDYPWLWLAPPECNMETLVCCG